MGRQLKPGERVWPSQRAILGELLRGLLTFFALVVVYFIANVALAAVRAPTLLIVILHFTLPVVWIAIVASRWFRLFSG
jgi:hypothetical protein